MFPAEPGVQNANVHKTAGEPHSEYRPALRVPLRGHSTALETHTVKGNSTTRFVYQNVERGNQVPLR
jgi:hypothetical protein